MTATVKDLDKMVSDPQHRVEAMQCLNRAFERTLKIYEDLKLSIKDGSELSMVLLLLGASGAMISVSGDKSEELRKLALENALTFIAIHVRDFIEYEAREVH